MVGLCARPRGWTPLEVQAKAQFLSSVHYSVMILLSDILQSQCRPHEYAQQFTPEAEVYGSTLQLAVGDLEHLEESELIS